MSSSSLVNNESEDGIWYKSQSSTWSLVKFVRTANAYSGMYDAVVLTNDKMVYHSLEEYVNWQDRKHQLEVELHKRY